MVPENVGVVYEPVCVMVEEDVVMVDVIGEERVVEAEVLVIGRGELVGLNVVKEEVGLEEGTQGCLVVV